MNGKDLLKDTRKRVLTYARSGKGKTCLWAQALKHEEMRPAYAFDFDLRIQSVLAVVGQSELEHLTCDSYRDDEVPGQAFGKAQDKLRQLIADGKAGKAPATVVVDSLTFMAKSAMGQVLRLDGKAADATPQLQHYMSSMSAIETFISKLCALPCNVVVTAHEDAIEDEISGTVTRGIGISGKELKKRLPGYFNELWYLEVQAPPNKSPEYKVRTQGTNVIDARTLYSKVLQPVEDANLIWGKMLAQDEANRTILGLASDPALKAAA